MDDACAVPVLEKRDDEHQTINAMVLLFSDDPERDSFAVERTPGSILRTACVASILLLAVLALLTDWNLPSGQIAYHDCAFGPCA
jgi:hypothetical protein